MKKTFKTKWLAMFLSLLMVTSLVPMSVYAEDNFDIGSRTSLNAHYKCNL